ncbi:hypothetical protein CFOL_v3_27825 [Cephalotus follicularis]|uniref:Reverse transcriptase domain-containing protein n=1 Tax=Cephalotus follicularis TaxID=3775 RepID=A0A1Q3CW63_CEPFO|nr:hypothetical protein CFOL_v3_27825 [Cephalotus follicularis]
MFLQAIIEECTTAMDILKLYERASEHKVNIDKTGLFFSPNTPPMIKQAIKDLLGYGVENCYEKYLGLPAIVENQERSCFKPLKIRCGLNCKVGRRIHFIRQKKKSP